tara:strand:+ start:1541 stop:2467 length:927 start_codon:yes stop_codon:yes gene_type:complete
MKINLIDFNRIESDASQKKIYRSKYQKDSKILVDFSYNHNDYLCFLEVYDYLSTINISIPKIFDFDDSQNIIIMEDLGNNKYDKIINSIDPKNILLDAINSLIEIQNTKKPLLNHCLKKYNFTMFNEEISEFVDFYISLKNINQDIRDEFLYIWKLEFEKLNFRWNSFVHKDFELQNLIYLPQREGHLKCGILDFQSAYIGFSGWDLFSLLENPRIYFEDKDNAELVEYFFNNTNQTITFKEYLKQYYFLNTARQTRVIGRWINLDNKDKNNIYSKYLDVTIRRLNKSLHNLGNKKLTKLYNKIITNE